MLPDDTLRDVIEMQSLIDDTLDDLRGRSVDEPLQMVDLVAMIESSVDDFSRDQQVTVDVPGRMCFRSRSMALQRALRNLVDKVIKYDSCAHARRVDPDLVWLASFETSPLACVCANSSRDCASLTPAGARSIAASCAGRSDGMSVASLDSADAKQSRCDLPGLDLYDRDRYRGQRARSPADMDK